MSVGDIHHSSSHEKNLIYIIGDRVRLRHAGGHSDDHLEYEESKSLMRA